MHPQLQQLRQHYDQLVQQVQQGVVPGPQAQSTLESLTVADANGALWSIDVYGNFLRAQFAGAPPAPADPSQFAETAAPAPAAGPAFPSPFPGGFDQNFAVAGAPGGGFDPNAPIGGGFDPTSSFGDGSGQAFDQPAAAATGKQPKGRSLSEAGNPKSGGGFAAGVLGILGRNKTVFAFVAVGIVLVLAAVIVPKFNGGGGTDVPSDSMPTTQAGGVPPAATSDLPSTADAKVVLDNLASGTAENVQAVIATPLDAPTLLRVQTAWRGAAELEVVTTAGPAAAGEGGAIVQKWDLTPPAATAPTSSVTVTWVRDGDAWKLAAPPVF